MGRLRIMRRMMGQRSQLDRGVSRNLRRVGLLWLIAFALGGCGNGAGQHADAPQPTGTPVAATTDIPAVATVPATTAEHSCPGGSTDKQAPSSTARAPDQKRKATSVDVSYDGESNTIALRSGASVTLAEIGDALGEPNALRESAPGEWLLSANLLVEQKAALRIAAPEVQRLKLRSDEAGFISIKVLGGRLDIEGTCITSWDGDRNTYDQNYADGRSFVLARNGARMDIRNAELSYLGYDADQSYGVAWRLAGTTGEIINSRLGYNFYGLYSYEASDLVIRGNEVHHSVRYGIDPHTRSNRLLIERNLAHHNGKHGIILAEACTDSTIRDNHVYGNTLHGIVIYQGSNNNLVEGNTAYGNGQQGINVNDSSGTTIRSNTVYGNAESGIGVGQDADDTLVEANRVYGNHEDGIFLYSDATNTILRENIVNDNARYGMYIKSTGNIIGDGNQIFGNTIGVYLNVHPAPDVSRQTNRIYDNREADVRDDAN